MSDRFWSKVARGAADECWLWQASVDRHGYGRFSVNGRTGRAHRRAWELVHGTIPAGLVVRHRCDVPLCCNPAHLEVGTVAENARDMVERGRGTKGEALAKLRRGERNGRARLTAAQVLEIRAKFAAGGRTKKSLADEYRISDVHASGIVRGKWWPHLPAQGDERDPVADPRVGDLWQWDEGQHTARVTRVLPADRARGFLSPRIALEWRGGVDHVGWWQGQGWSPVRDGGAR